MDPLQRAPANQAPPLVDYDAIGSDAAVQEAVRAFAATDDAGGSGASGVLDSLGELGRVAGSAVAREHGRLANEHVPRLRTTDRFGNRVDEVEFHPSWHWLLERGVGFGLQAAPWTSDEPSAHLRRAAGYVAWTAVEPGHACPMTMTYAAVPALKSDDALAKQWTSGLASRVYDFGLRRPADKAGLLAAMAMTEKQGGSDGRANVTTASPTSDHGEYRLHGHKWFTSAPMDDMFLMLAQAPDGLTCFVVPRVLPDGARNPLSIVRLKDKVGNRSNASAELELHDTVGTRLGDEGRGVRTIIEMVAATRLDCVLGSAALMRRAVAEASWHAAHRSAFGTTLAERPAMRNVLADLATESEAATLLGLRLAASVDRHDNHEVALRRIGLPLAKFWVCKRTPMMVAEAMECLGGNGYVEVRARRLAAAMATCLQGALLLRHGNPAVADAFCATRLAGD